MPRRSLKHWSGTGVVVALMLVVSSAGLAGAHGGDAARVHGCLVPSSGTIRIIGPDDECKRNETALDWSQSDTDTTYSAGSGLALDPDNEFSVTGAPWSGLTGVPSDIADGDDDTTYAAGDNLSLDPASNSFSVTGAPWSGLTGVPPGFSDGVDNDTTYTGANFATSNQSCPQNLKVTGVNSTGQVACGTDANTTYSGANFATSNQGCAANQFATGISGSGSLRCDSPQGAGTQLYAAQKGSSATDRIELSPVREDQTCCQYPVTTLLSVNVPAGTYLVTSSLELENEANFALQDNSRALGCGINTTFFDAYWLDMDGNSRESLSPQSLVTLPAAGTIALQCAMRDGGTDRSYVEAATRSLAALKIDTLG